MRRRVTLNRVFNQYYLSTVFVAALKTIMNYLEGTQLKKRTPILRKYIGQKVQFLTFCDIDTSGRGYFFPRSGVITDVKGRNIFIDDNPFWLSTIREIVLPPNGA